MTLTRYLFRRVLRSPGFTVMVVLTIALGIGVNCGIFSLTKAIFLQSLGVPAPNRLVYYTLGTGPDTQIKFADQEYRALRSTLAKQDILAWLPTRLRLQTPGGFVRLDGALVSGNAFSVLRLKPFLGRFFGKADDVPGGGKEGWTAVLGYSYWKSHWGANPNIVGRTITLDGALVQIVGVLPHQFTGIEPLSNPDILLPRQFGKVAHIGGIFVGRGVAIFPIWFVLGRLPSGVSIHQLRAKLQVIEPAFLKATNLPNDWPSWFPNTKPGSLLGVHDAQMGVTLEFRSLRTPLVVLELLAAALLLFCCCNLVLLFIGRARREAHATAIRFVLGARLADQARLAMAEATMLAGMGCLLAFPIAWSTARFLSLAIQSAPGLRTFPTISPGNSLLLTAAAVTLTIACLTAAGASVWQARNRPSIRLKEAGPVVSRRSPSWIVGFEVFASILLITATVTSAVGLQTLSHDSGFGDGSAVMVQLNSFGGFDPATFFSEVHRIVSRIRSSPGVQAVATTGMLPLSSSSSSDVAKVYGAGGVVRKLYVSSLTVSVNYFSAIGTKIVRGRGFIPRDLAGGPACVLSRNAASALFPDENPVGKYLDSPACRIVGISEDAHFTSMSLPANPVVYQLSRGGLPFIVVKATTSGMAVQAVRNAVDAVIPRGVGAADTIQSHVNKDLRLWRVTTLAGTLCASLVSVILMIGFFGILSLQVAERRREIGIRIAIGANWAQVSVALIKTLGPAVLVGLALGSAGALPAAVRLAQLYHLTTTFVIAGYLGSLALLVFLMLAASALPLSRAIAISPVECLSSE